VPLLFTGSVTYADTVGFGHPFSVTLRAPSSCSILILAQPDFFRPKPAQGSALVDYTGSSTAQQKNINQFHAALTIFSEGRA